MNKKICLLVSLITLLTLPLMANNISIDGYVTLTDQSTVGEQSTHYTHLQFDISWENSWRVSTGPSNWDAAWVFAKWKLHSGSTWAHCTLSATDGDHTAPTGSTIDATAEGIFIYRSGDGSGPNNLDNAKLRWNYGIDVADDATVDVKVFAIEMVYVPQGDFYVGDGVSTCRFHDGDNDSESFQVTSSQIEFGQSDGKLWGCWCDPGYLQANYPTGYKAFYCMKYEISQGQYADFLNTLTYDQQNTRTATAPSSTGQVNYNNNRNGLEVQTAGIDDTVPAVYGIDFNDDGGNLGENIPCNYLSWADGAAYSDWAGLRPMTELEFEKICRGTLNAVNDEYAWGNANIASSVYTLIYNGKYNETVSNAAIDPTGNASYYSTDYSLGPFRCGIFATSTSTRTEAGASYYGVMEMSGNLDKRPVTVCNATGRAFTGTNGNGAIDTSGDADADNWPSTTAEGACFRGGNWLSAKANARVSDRYSANTTNAGRGYCSGFRCVRSAPQGCIL